MSDIKPCPICDHSATKGYGVVICNNCGFQATPIHWDKLFNKRQIREAYEAGYEAAMREVKLVLYNTPTCKGFKING